jgi:hypothetical protein
MQSGIRSVYIEFPDGYKAGVSDNWPQGEEPEWYFHKEINHKYHMNDMPLFLQKVAELAALH